MTKLERFEPTEEGDMVPVQLSAISIGAWVRDEDAEAIEQERDALKAKLEYTDALYRHLLAESPDDPDTGLLHAAHAAWNALARLELLLKEEGE